jgi:hypothetical protein
LVRPPHKNTTAEGFLDDDWLVTLLNRPIVEDEFILVPYLETCSLRDLGRGYLSRIAAEALFTRNEME